MSNSKDSREKRSRRWRAGPEGIVSSCVEIYVCFLDPLPTILHRLYPRCLTCGYYLRVPLASRWGKVLGIPSIER